MMNLAAYGNSEAVKKLHDSAAVTRQGGKPYFDVLGCLIEFDVLLQLLYLF